MQWPFLKLPPLNLFNFPKIKSITSPCVGKCSLTSGTCTGCGRTSLEIESWLSITEEERQCIINEARERL